MKIAVVAGICIERDAISAAAAQRAEMLATLPGVDDAFLVAQHFDRQTAVEQVVATNAWELVKSRRVADCDLVIFHWGIDYDAFGALPMVNARQNAVVHFHNVTPSSLLSSAGQLVHSRTNTQLHLPNELQIPIWTESRHNRETLEGLGYDIGQISFVPFAIEPPRPIVDLAPNDGSVALLTVGRVVPAKGIDILLRSMRLVIDVVGEGVSLDIIGSRALSHDGFTEHIDELMVGLGLSEVVTRLGDVDDAGLWKAYERAHVLVSPSLHEGLCVPVLEAYHAGCRVIGTDAGNLPFIIQPPDPVVPAGDVDAMAEAIIKMIAEIRSHRSVAPPGVGRVLEAYGPSAARRALVARIGAITGQTLAPAESGLQLPEWPGIASTNTAEAANSSDSAPS